MDLQAINRTAIFIPTPSQTEQEYLAKWMQQNERGTWVAQSDFEIENYL
jgi:UDP-N-acetylglucosamine:LPS N-acetylglucosamine transferase